MLFFAIAIAIAGNPVAPAEDNVIVLEGSYQERNVFVINSISGSGVGYCTYEVRVNGEVTTDNINSSAFEIDLEHYEFKPGAPVFIEIRYKEGCSPKVVNPNVLLPKPSFKCENITINEAGELKWSTTGETGSLPFIVQQFKWNKWISITEVAGNGSIEKNNYEAEVELVSGLNRVRVIQKGFNGEKVVSQEAKVSSNAAAVTWEYSKRDQKIVFDRETAYELYDRYGRLKKRGFGEVMDVSNMEAENYWLSYDSMTDPFERRGRD